MTPSVSVSGAPLSPSPTIVYPTVTPNTRLPNTFGIVTPEPSANPLVGLSINSPTPEGTPLSGVTVASIAPNTTTNSAVCFPASATVQLRDGQVKTMAELEIGDVVAVGDGQYSPVFMFTHKMQSVETEFVRIATAHTQLTLTSGHYLYLSGALRAAGSARVGDSVETDDGVVRIECVQRVTDRGLYNPQTLHGDVVVNGVRTSTFTTAVQPTLAQAMLAPLRAAFVKLGLATSMLDSGADAVVPLLPRGLETVV